MAHLDLGIGYSMQRSPFDLDLQRLTRINQAWFFGKSSRGLRGLGLRAEPAYESCAMNDISCQQRNSVTRNEWLNQVAVDNCAASGGQGSECRTAEENATIMTGERVAAGLMTAEQAARAMAYDAAAGNFLSPADTIALQRKAIAAGGENQPVTTDAQGCYVGPGGRSCPNGTYEPPPAMTTQAAASAATGKPNQSVPPTTALVPMSNAITNTSQVLAQNAADADIQDMTGGGGVPSWIWIAAAAGALLLLSKGGR